MRRLPAFVLLCCGSLPAQSVLATRYPGDHIVAGVDAGVYFDLTTFRPLRIDRLDLNLDGPVGATAFVEVHVQPGSWIGQVEDEDDWVRVAVGTASVAGRNRPSACTLVNPIGLPPGDFGVAVRVQGARPVCITSPLPQAHSNADLRLVGGGVAPAFLASTPAVQRIFSGALHYTPGGGPYATASVAPRGDGCNRGVLSFYELFAPDGFDLAHKRIFLAPNTSGGYQVVLAQGGAVTLPLDATNLGLGRGVAAFVQLPASVPFPGGTTSTLTVFADGRLLLTGEGLVGNGPKPPGTIGFFGGAPTVAAAWQDYAPNAANNVYTVTDQLTGAVTVIWWRVPVHGVPGTANTFAVTVHLDGALMIEFDAVDNAQRACMTGYSGGAGAHDPGPRDLTANVSFATRTDDPGLALAARGRPAVGTTVRLTATGHPATTAVAALGFAWQPLSPWLDLTPHGAPDCQLHLPPADTYWLATAPGQDVDAAIPGVPAFVGLAFHVQGAAWAPGANALGLVTTNALALGIGSV